MTLETVRCFGTEQRKAPRPSPERHERHAEASLRHAPQVSVSAPEQDRGEMNRVTSMKCIKEKSSSIPTDSRETSF